MKRKSALRSSILAFGLLTCLVLLTGHVNAQTQTTSTAPIMIIAPHPDDEALTASGVIYNKLQSGGRVKIVVVTNGDFQGQAKGLEREGESVAALAKLGVDPQDIIFLGYPDTHMGDILAAGSDTQVFTSYDGTITATYGNNGFGGKDWHSTVFGVPAPYTRQAVMTDMKSVIEAFRPTDIYTTAEIDVHEDHNATYFFVHNALTIIEQELPTYQPIVHKTVVHDSVGPDNWPLPTTASGVSNRFDPTQAFTLPLVAQGAPEMNLPLERLPVPTPMLSTNSSNNLKFQVISRYYSQAGPALYPFCKKDEFFWIDPPITFSSSTGSSTNVALNATVTASSQNINTGQTAAKAIDGVIDGYPNDYTKEWATVGGGPGSWLKLTWSSSQTINKVVLYDRPNLDDQVLAATMVFSDGSSIPVGALNNDGTATTVTFPSKTITSLTFTVNNSAGSNTGLAEIQVFSVATTSSTQSSATVTRGVRQVRAAATRDTALISNNAPPIINNGPSINPQPVTVGSTATLSVNASSPSNNALAYAWVPEGGAVSGSGSSVGYSNTTSGNFRVQLIIADATGSSVSSEFFVTVVAGNNSSPVIVSEPQSNPNELNSGGSSTLSVVASDPNNSPLTYLWSASQGTISGNGPTVRYTAPVTPVDLVVTVTVTIENGRGGVVSDKTTILVAGANHPPAITSKLSAKPNKISSGKTSVLTVLATDVDGDPLTYSWNVSAGSIKGSGNSVTFTAPQVKNNQNVVVTVTVSDGRGGTASSSVSITVTK
ncbi:MAG TPA: PIG-L family deacetylase [Blastocatellia bacterium]|nr:PIG-L family deacetylase [Blastocatellia bacterium]